MAVRQRLQRIQNSVAHLVCSEPAFSHAAPLLHSLHWLPVTRRIKYKLCVLMFDVFHIARRPCIRLICAAAVPTTDYVHQPVATSLCGEQGQGSPRARSLSQDPLPATHSRLTSGIIDSHSAFCCHLKIYLFTAPD